MQQRLLSPAGQSICLVSYLPCHSLRHAQVNMYVSLIIAVELYAITIICCSVVYPLLLVLVFKNLFRHL